VLMMIRSLVRNYIPSYQWGFALTSSVRNAFGNGRAARAQGIPGQLRLPVLHCHRASNADDVLMM